MRRRPRLADPRAVALAVVGGLVALAPGARAAAPAPDAPLGAWTPGPLRGLSLDMPLDDARGAPSPFVDVRWLAANAWSVPTVLERGGDRVVVRLDAQTDVLQAAVAIPWPRAWAGALRERLATRVEARLLRTWGGWTDRPIEAWHGAIGSWNFQREVWARDAVDVRLGREDGRGIGVAGPRTALGDVAVRTALRIAGDGAGGPGRLALALRLDVKLPTGAPSRLGGSGSPDAGVGVAATWTPVRWLTGHGMASLRALGPLPRGAGLRLRPLQAGIEASLVARLGEGVAVVVEDRLLAPAFGSHGWTLSPEVERPQASAWYALFRAHNQVSAGLRVGELTVYVSEDFTPGTQHARDARGGGQRWFYDSNAPDLALGVAWTRRL
ncbi:conserved hypothetical protein [Anaeromyxobacter dehalogenans 2CP-1]|uniref:DUF3187 family protein n=1 Tax=Anaeromyxobacter dehalogenans (strain ATCC BAA-258 / DSM 21875 / 2CP-1) TaxID=455488 RepID=B8J9Y3_ANAD2|nr:hypothetical protein [Anaeromyxobacter dehalogenans]ACL63686.1 conserved hypothetical protein [Anaeromyxobacter dehalogenans 2CP-1]